MSAPTYEKLQPPTSGQRVEIDAAGHWKIPDDPIVCLLRGDGIGRDVGSVPGITQPAPSRSSTPPWPRPTAANARSSGSTSMPATSPASMYYPAGQGRAGRHPHRGRAAPALPARRHAQGLRILRARPQGPADHAHRRRLPQHQRLPAHALRPVCLRPARASTSRASRRPTSGPTRSTWCIFRENTEDVYCGIEFKSGSDKAKKLIALLHEMGYTNDRCSIRPASASSR